MIIAITGCIGSGKSYLNKLINDNFHYQTFSCDDFVKEAYEDKLVKDKLDKKFHCIKNNVLDKEILRKQLDKDSIKNLNDIIHPYVIEKIKKIAFDNKNKLVFIEVPLLFETNLNKIFDYTISISTSDELRHQKLKDRDATHYENMLDLEKYQYSNSQKANLSTFIINNNYNELENLSQIAKIIEKILNQ